MQTWKKMSAPWPLSGDTCGCFVLNDCWLMSVVIVDGSRLEMYSSSSTRWQHASEGLALGHSEVIRKGWKWMLLLSDGYLLLLLSPFCKPLETLCLFVCSFGVCVLWGKTVAIFWGITWQRRTVCNVVLHFLRQQIWYDWQIKGTHGHVWRIRIQISWKTDLIPDCKIHGKIPLSLLH